MKTILRKMVWGLVITGMFCAHVAGAVDFYTWQKKMAITFSGYTQGEALTNFPALVVLNDGNNGVDFADFKAMAADLRFMAADNATELNYEIDHWNDANGKSAIWVQIPVLTNNAVIYAYWGKPEAETPAYTTDGSTWDANYVGVWHFGTSNGVMNFDDSTARELTGTNYGASNATGQIGDCRSFNGNVQYVNAGNPGTSPNAYTLECWAKRSAISGGSFGTFLSSSLGFTQNVGVYENGDINFGNFTGTWAKWTGVWTDKTEFHHIAVIATNAAGSAAGLYFDGAGKGNITTDASGPFDQIRMGGNAGSARHYFEGNIDEVRVSNIMRSPNWVWASHATVASNSLFATHAAVQQNGMPVVDTQPAINVTETAATLCGYLSSTGLSATAVSVYWGETDGGDDASSWSNSQIWSAPQAPGAYSTTVALTSGREYFYRFAASNDTSFVWAPSSAYLISDPLTVSVTPASIGENMATGIFTVARSASLTTGAITVFFQTMGTASNGFDYTLIPGMEVTLDAGVASATVQAIAWPDSLEEDDETAILVLKAGAYVTNSSSTATLSITNIPTATTASAWWVGAAGPNNWSIGANWTNGFVPANDGTASIRFDQTNSGRITRLDPENLSTATNVWQISNLRVANSLTNETTTVDFTHVHDLGGNRLVVAKDVKIATDGSFASSWARAHFTNGTLQVGLSNAPATVLIGNGSGTGTYGTGTRYGELKICPGATFDPYISTLQIGGGYDGGGVLDLRGASVANGILNVQDLQFCVGGIGNHGARNMQMLLDSATNLREFRIRRYFDLGGNQQYHVRIGDPANDYKLPPDVSFTIGSPESRGRFHMASLPYMGGSTAYLVASSGGQFTAYVENVLIHPGYFGKGTPLTTFDIRGMTNVLIDCSNEFSIGKSLSLNEMGYNTKVLLCRGQVTCKDLIVGTSPVKDAFVWLELNGTVFSATNSVTLGVKAFVTNNVAGISSGLDLPANATLSITSPGRLAINFTAPQDPADTSTAYWGLRWAGDHTSELQVLMDEGKIVTSSSAISASAKIYLWRGSTLIGYVVNPTVITIR